MYVCQSLTGKFWTLVAGQRSLRPVGSARGRAWEKRCVGACTRLRSGFQCSFSRPPFQPTALCSVANVQLLARFDCTVVICCGPGVVAPASKLSSPGTPAKKNQSLRRVAAVDREHRSCYPRRFVRRKIERHPGDILGRADAAKRMAALVALAQPLVLAMQHVRHHRRINRARADDVAAHLVLRVRYGDRARERNDAALGRGIGMHAADPEQSRERRRVDDRSAAGRDYCGNRILAARYTPFRLTSSTRCQMSSSSVATGPSFR